MFQNKLKESENDKEKIAKYQLDNKNLNNMLKQHDQTLMSKSNNIELITNELNITRGDLNKCNNKLISIENQ